MCSAVHSQPVPLPSGLSGFQRAMAHQYCDELCVANESRGEEPNRSLTLYKKNDANESAANKFKRELGELLKTKNTLPETQDSIMLGVPGWKDRYYKQKMPENDDDEGRQAVARSYVEGLCWVMRYYYDGCQSWKWFFPYHYAPFAADIANAITPAASGGDEVDLEAGAPFAPFQQHTQRSAKRSPLLSPFQRWESRPYILPTLTRLFWILCFILV